MVVLAGGIAFRPTAATALIDMSGEWELVLRHPEVSGLVVCSATVSQTGSALSASMTCDQLGSGTLTGAVNLNSGTFYLLGMLGGNQVSFGGQSSSDGMSASGLWAAFPLTGKGNFSGARGGGDAGVGGVTELTNLPPLGGGGGSNGPGGGVPLGAWLIGGSAVAATLGALALRRR